MQELITTWTMAIASLIATLLLLLAIYTWPRGERRRCPGHRGWRTLWNPARWIRRSECWQDLTGVPVTSTDEIRCPECGRSTPIERVLRDGRRIRLGVIGAVLGVIAIGSQIGVAAHSGRPLRSIPTLALVMLSNTAIGEHRTVVRREIEQRVSDGAIAGFNARRLAGTLALNLRLDGRKWSANEAADALGRLWPDSKDALDRELVEGDVQSRKIVAVILRSRDQTGSMELFIASVDDLRDDGDASAGWLLQGNARDAGEYLIDHYWEAPELIRAVLDSDDAQQRRLAMVICGFAGDAMVVERVIPVLIDELRDNDIWGDARLAAPAVFKFGPPAIEALRPYVDDPDRQLRETVRSIIERLEHPDRAWDECENRLPRITSTTHDPLVLDFWTAAGGR